ncbi:hypothetical protein [Radiobacillus sp. PE A8.2]
MKKIDSYKVTEQQLLAGLNQCLDGKLTWERRRANAQLFLLFSWIGTGA